MVRDLAKLVIREVITTHDTKYIKRKILWRLQKVYPSTKNKSFV
jgi:hypothetical protein